MAKQIKYLWLKILTMSFTLYFVPIGHFVMSLFGISTRNGNAVAGTITCGGKTKECGGVSAQTLNRGSTVTCQCSTDSKLKQDLACTEIMWEEIVCDNGGTSDCYTQEIIVNDFWTGECYNPDACSPNGSTKSCSTSTAEGTRTCKNGVWGGCVTTSCKSGYVMVKGSCIPSCNISNGVGYEDSIDSSSSSEA